MSDEKTGKFIGLPYDFRPLTRERFVKDLWNPDGRRPFVPRVMAVGYSANFHEITRRAELVCSQRSPAR